MCLCVCVCLCMCVVYATQSQASHLLPANGFFENPSLGIGMGFPPPPFQVRLLKSCAACTAAQYKFTYYYDKGAAFDGCCPLGSGAGSERAWGKKGKQRTATSYNLSLSPTPHIASISAFTQSPTPHIQNRCECLAT